MKVRYRHYRFAEERPDVGLAFGLLTGRHGVAFHYQRGKSKWEPLPRGGYTICTLYNEDDEEVAHGVAECSPLDSFCYRIGRAIARGRATKALCKFKQMDADMRKLNSARSQPDWWGAEHDDPAND